MDQLQAAKRVYFLFPLTGLHTMDVLLGLQIHLKHGVLQRLMPPETMSLVEDILAIAQPIALAIQVGYHLNISLISDNIGISSSNICCLSTYRIYIKDNIEIDLSLAHTLL